MKFNIPLITIIAIAIFLRFFQIGSIPPHPSLDEVSIGYNAYSILKTGADEYGEKFPILLRAYDDWRPALYVYLVIPFVKLFGLNIFSVRLPSIILSTVTVAVIYFLVGNLVRDRFFVRFKKIIIGVPLLTSFFLAISPWHIYISRLGHEVNAYFSFFMIGLFLLVRFLKNKGGPNLIFAAIFFGLSFDAYQSGKIFLPLILATIFALFFKKFITKWKTLIFSLIVGVLIIAPVLFASTKPQALIRFQATNIFATADSLLERNANRLIDHKSTSNVIGTLVDNRRVIYPLLFSQAYLSHLNLLWLGTNTGIEDFKVPDFGLLYLFEIPLVLIGIFVFSKNNFIDKRFKILLLLWFVFAILPAALTTGYPHAMRSFQLLPLPQLMGAIGLIYLARTKLLSGIMARSVLIVVVLVSAVWFYNAYFNNFPREVSQQFQFGIQDSISYAMQNENKYEQIIISNRGNLRGSYMFYLFFSKYDPKLYQKMGGTVSGRFEQEHEIGKYKFVNPNSTENISESILLIVNPGEITGNLIERIKFKNGNDAIWIIQN